MLRERKGEDFDTWLAKVEQQGITERCSFACSRKKNYEAVKAGLTLSWSQRSRKGTGTSPQALEAPEIWPGELQDLAQADAAM